MDDRERFPAPPNADEELGALTGATGSLTPDDPDGEFVPAETREVTDAEAARDITAATHRRRGEEHLPSASAAQAPAIGTRLGGDVARAPEDEHL